MISHTFKPGRACLECGERIVGRSDKKFCTDHCRATFHNRSNLEEKRRIQRINKVLRKNRLVIENMLSHGRSKVSREVLLGEGFRFEFYTHAKKRKDGTIQFFCYEGGYVEEKPGMINLMVDSGFI